MLEFQLPTKEVDYLDIVLPATGVGLVARWGTQFTTYTVAMWDTPTPKPKWKRKGGLLLSSDGEWVSEFDGEAGEVRITRVGTRKTFTVERREPSENAWATVSPGGTCVAWKQKNRTLVKRVADGELLSDAKVGEGFKVQFSSGGRWMTEEGWKAFRVFDCHNKYRRVASIKTDRHIVTDISEVELAVLTMPERDSVTVWDLANKKAAATFTVGGWICGLAISPDGKRILAGNTDGRFALWDSEGTLLKEYDWGIACPLAPTFSRDGTRAAVGGDDGKVIVWDLDD
jgi:WD40 repeat protein